MRASSCAHRFEVEKSTDIDDLNPFSRGCGLAFSSSTHDRSTSSFQG